MRIRSTANKSLGILRRTCHNLTDARVRRTLYLSFVKSHLSYGSQVWSSQNAIWMKRIEGVQSRATLWILGIKLAYDREIRDLMFYFKCRCGFINLDMDKFATIVSNRTRRGSSSYLQTPFCKTGTFKMFFLNRIVNLWNFILKLAPYGTFSDISSFK